MVRLTEGSEFNPEAVKAWTSEGWDVGIHGFWELHCPLWTLRPDPDTACSQVHTGTVPNAPGCYSPGRGYGVAVFSRDSTLPLNIPPQ